MDKCDIYNFENKSKYNTNYENTIIVKFKKGLLQKINKYELLR